MSLAQPVAISAVGVAEVVRHLRLSGESYVVWSYADSHNAGYRLAVRRITGVVNLIPNTSTGLRTDGTDFSEQILSIYITELKHFACADISGGNVIFLVTDGKTIKQFVWNQPTNTIVSPPTNLALADQPSVYNDAAGLRKFFVRNNIMYLNTPATGDIEILNLSSSDTVFSDVVSVDPATSTSRFVGSQLISQNLSLKPSADAQTVLCFNGETETTTLTQSLPPSTISFWTFDTADTSATQVLDVVGSNHGTVVSTVPTSTTGQVNQARLFSTSGGYYSVGNVASLRLNGDMSLAFWIKPNDFNNRTNPYAKAYGGEGTVTVETDGTINYFYGSAGGDTNPYNAYNTVEKLQVGVWQHVCVVRDMANRTVRWYINGRMVSSKPAHAASVGVSSNSVTIGRGYTGSNFSGSLDEMLVASAAWDSATIKALYEKGVAGQLASTSATVSSTLYLDKSSSTRRLIPTAMAIPTTQGIGASSAVTRSSPTLALASSQSIPTLETALTIEAKLLPRSNVSDTRSLFTTYVEPNSSGTRAGGSIYLKLTPELTLIFGFETATSIVEYVQYGGVKAVNGRENHFAVSHTFGSPASTFMSINGSIVNARWQSGSGNEALPLLPTCASSYICQGDELTGLRVSRVARSIGFIRTYLRGRS